MLLPLCFMSLLADPLRDAHSFGNPAAVSHDQLELDLKLDFQARVIHGKVGLRLVYRQEKADVLTLDTRDLTILAVSDEAGNSLPFSLGEERPFMGRPLNIQLHGGKPKSVVISYHSSPGAAALQWLSPQQTTSGKLPFLFTQSQAILARTWIPCIDSPGVRVTYSARVEAPVGIEVVMGARRVQRQAETGVFHFEMPFSIPPYLIALGAGELQFQAMSERTGVYAEPAVLAKAAAEFADAEKMILAAESLYGPYDWERFDILVLPPSFPFGGMENPMLTFATPTVIAGDKSLVSLLAHELAHSWSGNLVTNATWNDFWLNEGTTTYIESRIMEVLYGQDFMRMHVALGQEDLRETVAEMAGSPRDTHLLLDLAGRDPDDGMSDIAYEKGANFLRMLENHFGRPRFDAFLKSYFRRNAFQSITTASFLQQLRSELFADPQAPQASQAPRAWQDLQVDAWVMGPGLPSNLVVYDNPLARSVDAANARLAAGAAPAELATHGWITQQWIDFIRSLQNLDAAKMATLDAHFAFSSSGNAEILFAWFMRAIPASYEPAYPALEKFLTSMGRRKFLKPLYQELMKQPSTVPLARKIYQKARGGYHSIAVTTLDAILDPKTP